MRCCDCEFRKGCKDEDTVLTAFVNCSIREEKLKKKANQSPLQAEEYVKKSDLKNIGDVPWFNGKNGLSFDQHQTLVACCKAFKEFVDQLPTADVVEVVRCKDCAHRVALPKQYDYNGHFAMVCLMRSKSVKHNGYCDEGVRKAKKGGG